MKVDVAPEAMSGEADATLPSSSPTTAQAAPGPENPLGTGRTVRARRKSGAVPLSDILKPSAVGRPSSSSSSSSSSSVRLVQDGEVRKALFSSSGVPVAPLEEGRRPRAKVAPGRRRLVMLPHAMGGQPSPAAMWVGGVSSSEDAGATLGLAGAALADPLDEGRGLRNRVNHSMVEDLSLGPNRETLNLPPPPPLLVTCVTGDAPPPPPKRPRGRPRKNPLPSLEALNGSPTAIPLAVRVPATAASPLGGSLLSSPPAAAVAPHTMTTHDNDPPARVALESSSSSDPRSSPVTITTTTTAQQPLLLLLPTTAPDPRVVVVGGGGGGGGGGVADAPPSPPSSPSNDVHCLAGEVGVTPDDDLQLGVGEETLLVSGGSGRETRSSVVVVSLRRRHQQQQHHHDDDDDDDDDDVDPRHHRRRRLPPPPPPPPLIPPRPRRTVKGPRRPPVGSTLNSPKRSPSPPTLPPTTGKDDDEEVSSFDDDD
ncbi:hypothetical protein HDU67_003719, partial [Dinochytrium kinnereticum]